MRTTALTSLVLIGVVLAGTATPTPTGWRRLLPTVSGNVAITKERAERGEVAAQVELADTLAANKLAAQAAEWYRKTAERGSVEAKFHFSGITVGPVSLAIIKGQTLEEGDSLAIPVKEGTAHFSCVKITQDSVMVAVEGEGEPRLLGLR